MTRSSLPSAGQIESTPPDDGKVPARTANVAVFRAYVELLEARTGQEKVAILERLYREGWEGAIRLVDETDLSADDPGPCPAVPGRAGARR